MTDPESSFLHHYLNLKKKNQENQPSPIPLNWVVSGAAVSCSALSYRVVAFIMLQACRSIYYGVLGCTGVFLMIQANRD